MSAKLTPGTPFVSGGTNEAVPVEEVISSRRFVNAQHGVLPLAPAHQWAWHGGVHRDGTTDAAIDVKVSASIAASDSSIRSPTPQSPQCQPAFIIALS